MNIEETAGTTMHVRVEGAALRYREAGSGPPLVLIHGSGPDSDTWGQVFDDLARDHRVIAYNRRGYHDSGEPVKDWSVHGDDAARVIESLDAAPAHVLGLSGGGIVALDLAVKRPDLMRSLVLVEPGIHGRRRTTPSLALTFLRAQLMRRLRGPERGMDVFLRWVMSYSTGGSLWTRPDYPEERRPLLLRNADAMFADFAAGDGSHISRESLRAIECPVTIAVGELSQPWFHKIAAALREDLPAARFERIEDSSHAMVVDNPLGLTSVVRAATSG